MIDLDFLESLIQAIDQSGIDSIEIERGGTRIRLAKTPEGGPVQVAGSGVPAAPEGTETGEAPQGGGGGGGGGSDAPPAEEEAAAPSGTEVTSPMVGTFYRAPSPDAPPYVEVGDRVAKGDVLCIIEAMKLMNELECETAGTVTEVCVENAEPVEYGQPLFRVDPA